MTTSSPYNDQIPTDPTTWAVLLLIAATVIGRLTTDQAEALNHLLETTNAVSALALLARR